MHNSVPGDVKITDESVLRCRQQLESRTRSPVAVPVVGTHIMTYRGAQEAKGRVQVDISQHIGDHTTHGAYLGTQGTSGTGTEHLRAPKVLGAERYRGSKVPKVLGA